jgi:hypothetical protein
MNKNSDESIIRSTQIPEAFIFVFCPLLKDNYHITELCMFTVSSTYVLQYKHLDLEWKSYSMLPIQYWNVISEWLFYMTYCILY